MSSICILCLADLRTCYEPQLPKYATLGTKYNFVIGLCIWKCCCLFKQVIGSICFLLNHRDVAVQRLLIFHWESWGGFDIMLQHCIKWQLCFLDEAMHAMCSKGAIKAAVAAASFSFCYLEIFQLQNQIYGMFAVIKQNNNHLSNSFCLAGLMTGDGMVLKNRILLHYMHHLRNR